MESWIEKMLAKVTFLNLGSEKLRAEFAGHIGWSLVFPLMSYYIWGNIEIGAYVWIAHSIYGECISDGHLDRMLCDIESPEQFKDFYTDLLSRLIGPILLLIF